MSWSIVNGQYPHLTDALPMPEQLVSPIPRAMWQTDGTFFPKHGCFSERAALGSFANTPSLRTLRFKGTMAEWEGIVRGTEWASGSSLEAVQCADGVVRLN